MARCRELLSTLASMQVSRRSSQIFFIYWWHLAPIRKSSAVGLCMKIVKLASPFWYLTQQNTFLLKSIWRWTIMITSGKFLIVQNILSYSSIVMVIRCKAWIWLSACFHENGNRFLRSAYRQQIDKNDQKIPNCSTKFKSFRNKSFISVQLVILVLTLSWKYAFV
jgi:hypothetical protein